MQDGTQVTINDLQGGIWTIVDRSVITMAKFSRVTTRVTILKLERQIGGSTRTAYRKESEVAAA